MMVDLSAFQRDILYVVAGLDRPHGLGIKEELEREYDPIHHGRLYPNLDKLVTRGLVNKGKKNARTNSYELTAEGYELLSDRETWRNRYLGGRNEHIPEEYRATIEAND